MNRSSRSSIVARPSRPWRGTPRRRPRLWPRRSRTGREYGKRRSATGRPDRRTTASIGRCLCGIFWSVITLPLRRALPTYSKLGASKMRDQLMRPNGSAPRHDDAADLSRPPGALGLEQRFVAVAFGRSQPLCLAQLAVHAASKHFDRRPLLRVCEVETDDFGGLACRRVIKLENCVTGRFEETFAGFKKMSRLPL